MPHFNDEIENDSQLFSLFGVLCLLKNFGGQVKLIAIYYYKLKF